jgi:2,3-diketo-5-methylthio-1-phosphopentane phosphatase
LFQKDEGDTIGHIRPSIMNMKLALLVDFDGTVTEKDLAGILLNAFAVEDWRRFQPMLDAGLISFRECSSLEYSCLPNKEEELTQFALELTVIRPGFKELVKHCKEEEIPLIIVSGGLGFYIQAVLSHNGLSEIPVFSAKADFTVGDRVRMDFSGCPAVCDMVGACKCFHAQKYADLGFKVVLIGDGSSDTCVVKEADYVFARRKLQSHCEAREIPFVPFNDFHTVLTWLKGLYEAS